MYLTLKILLCLLTLFPLSQTTQSCNYSEIVCELSRPNFIRQRWCCQVDKICGKDYKQCDMKSNIRLFTYSIIFLSIIIIAIFIGRCIMLCLSCRHEHNENLSNNISLLNYQPILTIDSNISIEEESPPSYEQVMNNNNNLYRFENPR